ncbi:MAG: hypothetical protein CMN63_06785 [Sphingobium sp.]|nr:hypothetical protein [Sphingobium sp.]
MKYIRLYPYSAQIAALRTLVDGKAGAGALSAEIARAQGVEGALDGRLDAVETALPGKANAADLGSAAVANVGDFAPASAGISTAERNKLAGIAAGAQVNAVTMVAGKTGDVALAKGDVGLGNVDNTSDANKPISTAVATALAGKATSTQGAKADSAVQPGDNVSRLVETASAKIMTGAERTKLSGIATGATANDTDANLKKRENHTGTQPIASVTGLQDALDDTASSAQGARADSAVQPDDLDARVNPVEALIPRAPERAGDARALFSTVTTGDPLGRAPVSVGSVVATAGYGAALRLAGADVDPVAGYVDIAPRIAVPIYPGRTYRLTYRIARAADPADPANNGVELRWQNLNQNKNNVSNVRLGDVLTPVVADGVVTYSFVIGKDGAPGDLDYVVPPSAVYGLPFVRIFGNGQQTDLIAIEPPEDITDLGGVDVGGLGQDVSDLTGVVNGLSTDVAGLSEAVGGLNPVAFSGSASDLSETEAAKVLTGDERVGLSDLRETVDTVPPGSAGADQDGFADWYADRSGMTVSGKRLQLGDLTIFDDASSKMVCVDQDGFILFDSEDIAPVAALDAAISPGSIGSAGADRDGFADWYIDRNGMTLSGSRIAAGDLTITGDNPNKLLLLDQDGFILFDSDEVASANAATSDASVYAARDAANVAYAMTGQNDLMPIVQQIERGKVNIILTYGQSLRRSSRGYPPLTTTQPAYSDTHVFSFGQACRPADDDDTVYEPVTSAALYPLLAVPHYNDGTLIDNALLETIGPDTAVPGESVSISAAYWLRQQCLAKWGVQEDPDTPFVVLDCAVGGRSVAHLMKGANPNIYNRIPSGLTQIRDLPAFAGKEFVLAGVDWGQGENDYHEGLSGANPTVESYKGAVEQVIDDIYADTLAIFNNGQKRPAVFVAQAGGAFTTDATNLHVGQAQLNLVTQVDGYFPTGPNYPVVNVASAHPDNNGYRWLGQYCGRAWASVLVHGRRPNIVYPRSATWNAATNEVIIDFVSTGGPISEGHPYDGFTAQTVANLGISAKYGSTILPLSNVRLVGAMTVAATLPVTPAGAPLIQIGTKALDNGYIGLRCASRMVAPESYTFIPNAGQDPAANVPALVGKPYNLDDWCWAASLQSEEI